MTVFNSDVRTRRLNYKRTDQDSQPSWRNKWSGGHIEQPRPDSLPYKLQWPASACVSLPGPLGRSTYQASSPDLWAREAMPNKKRNQHEALGTKGSGPSTVARSEGSALRCSVECSRNTVRYEVVHRRTAVYSAVRSPYGSDHSTVLQKHSGWLTVHCVRVKPPRKRNNRDAHKNNGTKVSKFQGTWSDCLVSEKKKGQTTIDASRGELENSSP